MDKYDLCRLCDYIFTSYEEFDYHFQKCHTGEEIDFGNFVEISENCIFCKMSGVNECHSLPPRARFQCKMCRLDQFITKEEVLFHKKSSGHLQKVVEKLNKKVNRKDKKTKKAQIQMNIKIQEIEMKNSNLQNIQKLQVARDEEDAAYTRDEKTSNILFLKGFNLDIEIPYKKQIKFILNKYVPHNKYVVSKVQKVCKKKNYYHAFLSKASDVDNFFSHFVHIQKDPHIEINRVTSPATLIRFKILQTIAAKLESRYKTSFPYVNFINLKPHLFFIKDGFEKPYKFAAVMAKFQKLVDKLDFSNIKKYATTRTFTENDLKQFVVFK